MSEKTSPPIFLFRWTHPHMVTSSSTLSSLMLPHRWLLPGQESIEGCLTSASDPLEVANNLPLCCACKCMTVLELYHCCPAFAQFLLDSICFLGCIVPLSSQKGEHSFLSFRFSSWLTVYAICLTSSHKPLEMAGSLALELEINSIYAACLYPAVRVRNKSPYQDAF